MVLIIRILFDCNNAIKPRINQTINAPRFDPAGSAFLLAALVPFTPPSSVILGVVDPGVLPKSFVRHLRDIDATSTHRARDACAT
jgi:hypothetical protein